VSLIDVEAAVERAIEALESEGRTPRLALSGTTPLWVEYEETGGLDYWYFLNDGRVPGTEEINSNWDAICTYDLDPVYTAPPVCCRTGVCDIAAAVVSLIKQHRTCIPESGCLILEDLKEIPGL